jgi:hypothetical protein
MSDIADRANDQMQPMLEAGIKHICNKSVIDINGDGYCMVCKKPVSEFIFSGVAYIPRWCSKDCRDGLGEDD